MPEEHFIEELPTVDWNRLDLLLQQFEEAWERGELPDLDEFLPASGALRLTALVELIGIDLEYRFKKGWQPRVEAFLKTYPELEKNPEALLHLIAWECRLRKLPLTASTLEEYQRRFPTLAKQIPHHFAASNISPEPATEEDAPPQAETVKLRPTIRQNNSSGNRFDSTAAPSQQSHPGPHIPGYAISAILGRGGMGVVYRARHLKLNREVALKMILTGEHASPEEVARFVSEAEAVAALHHPNIVQIYEVGRHRDLPYMALEFVDGGSLADKIGESPLNSDESARLVEQLARAVNVAHQAGVVHRDLKPANVLLTKEGSAKITDFGLAKRVQTTGDGTGPSPAELTQSGAVLGTPAYMAPEQASGRTKRVGPAADVYALGAVLYRCLTGHSPFQGSTPMETVTQVLKNEPTPPKRHNPKTPRDLEVICLKCLQKEPHKRYPSAEALAEDLRRWRQGEPIQARPVGRMERGWRWCRRNPVVASLSALLILVLISGTLISGYFAVEAASRAHLEKIEREKANREARKNKALAEQANKLAKAEQKARKTLAREIKEKEKALQASEQERKKAEFVGYAFRIDAARQAVQRGQMRQAQDILRSTDPKLRGWEFDFVVQMTLPKLNLAIPHFIAPSAAFSPDGKWIIGAGSILHRTSQRLRRWGALQVWDSTTGAMKQTIKDASPREHCNISSVAFSADGTRVVAGNADGTITVWDFATAQKQFTLKGHLSRVGSVEFTPDGEHIVSSSLDGTFRVWDCKKRAELFFRFPGNVGTRGVGLSPDGKRVVTCSLDGVLRIWDSMTGEKLLTWKAVAKLQGRVYSVAFSPDSKRVAAAVTLSPSPGPVIKVWSASTGEELLTIQGSQSRVRTIAFSPDGKWIASGHEGKKGQGNNVKVWDSKTGKEIFNFMGHGLSVRSVAFSPDGKRIVSTGNDYSGGPFRVKVWECATRENASLPGHTNAVACMAFSPDGKHIVSGSHGRTLADCVLKVWDAVTGENVATLKGHKDSVRCVAISPDGKRIVSGSGDGTLKVWDRSSGKEVLTIEASPRRHVRAVAYISEGRQIISASHGNVVSVWDAEKGHQLQSITIPGDEISETAFSPDGKRLAGMLRDKTTRKPFVRVWDARTGKTLLTLAHGDSRLFAFSPNGKWIATGNTRASRVWDSVTGDLLLAVQGHTKPISAAAFSPDGRRFITGSQDKTVKIWDGYTGQEALTLHGHSSEVTGLLLSPDGTMIVSACRDRAQNGTLKIWQGIENDVPDLIERLGHEVRWRRIHATLVLAGFGKAVIPYLEKTLNSKNALVRQHAAKAMGLIGDGKAVPALRKLLADANLHVRMRAAEALIELKETEGLASILIEGLRDSNTRERAITGLATLGSTASEALGKAMKNPDATVRLSVVRTYRNMPPSAARHGVLLLLDALRDPDAKVRQEAACTIVGLNRYAEGVNLQGVSLLMKQLKNKDALTRRHAASTLGKFGGAAKPAVSALKLALKDKDDFVRKSAQEALDSIASTNQEFRGTLSKKDPFDRVRMSSRHKIHNVKLFAGIQYQIDLHGNRFDAFVRLEDADGMPVMPDRRTTTRLIFTPIETGMYRIVATSMRPATRSYVLKIGGIE